MSRTKHHRRQKANRAGLDLGARYECNRGYCGGSGPQAKDKADIERRLESKAIIRKELKQLDGEACPICEAGVLVDLANGRVVEVIEGNEVTVPVYYSYCSECGCEQVGYEQSRMNKQFMIVARENITEGERDERTSKRMLRFRRLEAFLAQQI